MHPDASQDLASPADGRSQAHRDPTLYLLYHELSPGQSDYKYALSTDSFREHLRFFRNLRSQGISPLHPRITFDDGHVSNFTQALPLLLSFGVAAHFFITAGWTSKKPEFMTWDQLRQLQRSGQQIGAHGWSHTLLTHCSDADLDHELRGSRLTLEDKLGIPVTTLSLPGGRFDRRVLNACKRAGYTQIFTSVPRAEVTADAPLAGRLNLRCDADVAWLEALFAPGSHQLRGFERQYRLKAAAQRILGDGLYGKLWALLNRADPDAHLA